MLSAELGHLPVGQRSVLLIDAGRTSGKDDAFGLHGPNPLQRKEVGVDLAVDVGFAHAPCDQLCVLAAEVEDISICSN